MNSHSTARSPRIEEITIFKIPVGVSCACGISNSRVSIIGVDIGTCVCSKCADWSLLDADIYLEYKIDQWICEVYDRNHIHEILHWIRTYIPGQFIQVQAAIDSFTKQKI